MADNDTDTYVSDVSVKDLERTDTGTDSGTDTYESVRINQSGQTGNNTTLTDTYGPYVLVKEQAEGTDNGTHRDSDKLNDDQVDFRSLSDVDFLHINSLYKRNKD